MSEKSTLAAVARASTEAVAAAAQPGAAKATLEEVTQVAAAAVKAAAQPGATADAVEAAVTAAKQRISTILALPQAKGREALAQQIAMTTELSVEQATALLGASPEAKPATAASPSGFDAAMRARPNPELGSGAQPQATDQQKIDAMWAGSIERANKMAGVKARH